METRRDVNVDVTTRRLIDYNSLINKPAIDGVVLTSETTKEDLGISNIQVIEMPIIDEGNSGRVVQYIGETTENYTHGYFYQATLLPSEFIINEEGSRLTGISNILIDQEKLSSALSSYGLSLPLDFQADHENYWTCVSTMGGSSLSVETEVLNDVWGITWDGTPEYVTPDLFTIIDIEERESYGVWERIDVQPSGGSSSVTAADVSYTNTGYPNIHNVEEALNSLLYVAPHVSISGGGNYEIGYVVPSVILSWNWNKTITSQSLNQGIGSLGIDVRTYTYTEPIHTTTSFTITGSDGTRTATASTSVVFSPKRYWGVSENTNLTDEQILGLSNELSTSRTQTRTFDCTGGKYFYFVIRTQYCDGISFKVNGLSFTDMDVETRSVINAQGYSASYNIYRVHNIQTGSAIQVQVL